MSSLDNLLGKPSRYVKTSVTINNKKLKDKSSQIKDTFSDTLNDNIVNPVSKRTTKPIGKFVRKAKVSKQINESNLEKLLKDSAPKKYDPIGSMKSTGTSQDMFNGMTKKYKPKKLTKSQKAESDLDYNTSNNYKHPKLPKPGQTATTSKQGSQQLVKPEKPLKISNPTKSKLPKKNSSDVSIVETFLHENRPKIKTPSNIVDSLIDQNTITGQAGIKQGSSSKLSESITELLKETTS